MLENTNTKQFYPGPILNDTLEISEFLFNTADQVKLKHSKFDEQGILHDVDLVFIEDYEVIKEEALTCEDESETPSHAHIIEMNLTASTGQIILKEHINVLAGEKLTAYRESALIQDKQYPRVGAFPAATHEGALDYLTMQNQEQQDELNRALKVPISTQNFEGSMPIPIPGRALKINQAGSGFEMSEFDPDTALLTTEEFKIQAQQAASEATKAATTATQQTDIVVNKVAAAEDMLEDFNTELNKFNYLFVMPIGTIGFSPFPIDETKGLRRILNGQIIIQEQFTGFVKWLKDNIELYPQMACTEEEWQATVTMSTFGQCGKFVIDDEAGTIRLPKITGFIQGLTDLASLGELVEAGLPTLTTDSTGAHTHTRGTMNITGHIGMSRSSETGSYAFNGALYHKTITQVKADSLDTFGTNVAITRAVGLDASKNWTGATSSNGAHTHTITGTADTVQPEAIRYPYFIQVATGVEETVDVTREIELNNPFFFGYYQYFEVAPNNISWLKSEGQWNAKAVYTDYYDWILTNANNGVENFKLSTDTYDDYAWVVNTADETFRLPIKTKNTPFKVTGADTTLSMGAVSIKGNGKSLGLTDGSLTGGMTANNNYAAYGVFQKGAYNVNVGTAVTPGSTNDWTNNNKSIGVTTDASKSGLTGSVSGTATTVVNWTSNTDVSLYFYVGETVQNANLVNAGRIEEVVVGKVNRTGDTMTGDLYIAKDYNPILFLKNTSQERGVAPSENAGTQYLYFVDKNNDVMGSVAVERCIDGRHTSKLQAFSADGTFAPAIRVTAKADNTASFTLSHNPANTSNSTDIATTSFCDGNWTYKYLALANGVVLSNTANTTFNLASYLPNDGRTYEVLLSYNGSATSSSQYNFDTGWGTMFGFAPIDTNISGIVILPVTTRRTILVMPTTITKGTNTYSFRVNAYRKVR